MKISKLPPASPLSLLWVPLSSVSSSRRSGRRLLRRRSNSVGVTVATPGRRSAKSNPWWRRSRSPCSPSLCHVDVRRRMPPSRSGLRRPSQTWTLAAVQSTSRAGGAGHELSVRTASALGIAMAADAIVFLAFCTISRWRRRRSSRAVGTGTATVPEQSRSVFSLRRLWSTIRQCL